MSSLIGSIRGTVQGVLGATQHVLWWVSWHTGSRDDTRTTRERPGS